MDLDKSEPKLASKAMDKGNSESTKDTMNVDNSESTNDTMDKEKTETTNNTKNASNTEPIYNTKDAVKPESPKLDIQPKSKGVWLLGARHGQALLMFICLLVAYALRVNLSVGIVAMTDSASNPDFPELAWDAATKGTILSSYFWGYLVMQIPAGQLAEKFGPKYLLAGSVGFCGLMTLLTPLAAVHGGWLVMCATRVAQGLGQGFIYPSVNTHMSKWAPPQERSRIFSFVFSGTIFGTVVMMPVAGLLAAGPGGWPSIFYVSGLAAVVWALVWVFIGADSPAKHATISDKERKYIETALVHSSAESSVMPTPWREICLSVPMWALLVAHLGQNWGFWTLLTLMPSYISSALGFDIKSNGFLSALPYFSMWLFTIVCSWIADYINDKKLLSLNVARKMWNSISHWGGAMALVALACIGKDVVWAIALLTVAVTLNAGTFTGYLCNHLDLAPNFAGTLMGITNGLANITSILGPLVAGFLVPDQTSADQWRIVFFLAAAIFFLANLVFVVFGSTHIQPWNEPKKQGCSDIA